MLIYIVIALLAAIIGFFIGRYTTGGDSNQAEIKQEYEQRLEKAERELAGYREKVTEHFQGTAQLVEQMNENYREVYQHLAQGAQQLTDSETTLKAAYPPLMTESVSETLPLEVEASHEAKEQAAESDNKKVDESGDRDQAVSARNAGL